MSGSQTQNLTSLRLRRHRMLRRSAPILVLLMVAGFGAAMTTPTVYAAVGTTMGVPPPPGGDPPPPPPGGDPPPPPPGGDPPPPPPGGDPPPPPENDPPPPPENDPPPPPDDPPPPPGDRRPPGDPPGCKPRCDDRPPGCRPRCDDRPPGCRPRCDDRPPKCRFRCDDRPPKCRFRCDDRPPCKRCDDRRRDFRRPFVVAEFPRDGARNVSVFTDVVVKFSESVRGVDEHSFTLRRAFSGKRVSAFVFQESRKVFGLRPDFRLRSFTRYVVTVEGGRFGIRDRAGNRLFDERWTFSTGRDRRFDRRADRTGVGVGVDPRTIRALRPTG